MCFIKTRHLIVGIGSTLLMACTPGVQSGDISSKFAGVQGGTAVSPTAVNLTWIKSPDYTTYQVYSSTQANPLTESVFASATIEQLTPSTNYTFKVIGKGSADVGGDVQYSVSTWPRFTGVDNVYKNSDGALVVQWVYPFPVTQFEIFYQAGSPPTAASTNNWAQPNAISRAQNYTFKGLTGSTTYYFVVHALYRQGEYERTTKSLFQSTNSSFPAPFYQLPAITIGSLPSILIQPVVTDQFPAADYVSRVYQNGVQVADPVRGVGQATFASTVPLPLGKIDNITLTVQFQNATINETLSIPGLSTYLKGIVPYVDSVPVQNGKGPAFMGQSMVVGDFNCDGFDDLAVGLPYAAIAQFGVVNAQSGAVYIYYGGLNNNGIYSLRTTPAPSTHPAQHSGGPPDPQVITFPDLSWHAQFGFSLAKGNLNGDKAGPYSCDDLAVGAPGQVSPDGTNSGNVFVFYGTAGVGLKAPATVASFPQNSETCDGRAASASCTAVRLWPNYNLWPASVFGQAYVPTTSSYNVGSFIRFGEAVSFVGDFNADGYEDLAIGAPDAPWDGVPATYVGTPGWNSERVGYVAMYFGSPFGLGFESPLGNGTQFRWLKIFPPLAQPGMRFGASLAGGDVDGRNRVLDDNSVYQGGGDLIVGAPQFFYNDPTKSQYLMSATSPDANISVTPGDGGWWGNALSNAGLATNPRYGFPQNTGGRAQGTAFVFFGRSLGTHSTTPNSQNPPRSTFWNCGRRGMSTAYSHYSCMADVPNFRVIFPRDASSYGFGTAVAVAGDKTARDSNDNLRCVYGPGGVGPGPLTGVAQGACRDGNGDSFGDIIVMASDADAPASDGRKSIGALWEFFGNFDQVYESGNADNFYPAGPTYYNSIANCQNFALSGLAPGNSGFAAADRKACAPTLIRPNSVPTLAAMGKFNASISVGDVTRDGLLDIAVGAPYDSTLGSNAGAVYAFTSLRGFGITSNYKKMISQVSNQDDKFGYSTAIGDFDPLGIRADFTAYTCSPDGSDPCTPASTNFSLLAYNDVAAGAPYEDHNSPGGGGVHLFNSGSFVLPAIRTTSDVDLSDSLASLQEFGYGEARIVGDINGDGYDDAVTHLQSFTSAGGVAFDGVVYYGSSIGLVTTSFCLANQARIFISGSNAAECYPSRTHASGITIGDIVLPQLLVQPNNVSSGWAEIAFSAGDVNGDGFADVAFVDPCYLGANNCTQAQVLVYYGTRAGLQDIVIPSWTPATNDPQIVSQQVTVATKGFNNNMYTDLYYQYANFLQFGDFNGDGYSDIVIANPEATGPSLTNHVTAKDPIDGHTETIADISAWPPDASLNASNPIPTIWRCPSTATTPAPECINGSGTYDHGLVYIFYGSSTGVATPSMYTPGATNSDLQTPGVALNFVYGSEDVAGTPIPAGIICSSLSTASDCIPAVNIIRNPVLVNLKNGYRTLSHYFGASVAPIRINRSDTFDSLVISAPGYSNMNCQNYVDPSTQAPQLNQGRLYVFRGSNIGVTAYNKTGYYAAATAGGGNDCATMADATDVGLGLDAIGHTRAMRMAINTGAPSTAEQNTAFTAVGSGVLNAFGRDFGIRLANVGDIDGDGVEDLVVMAPYENVYDQNLSTVVGGGAGYVIYGPICPSDNDNRVQTAVQDPTKLNQQVTFAQVTALPAIAGQCAGKKLAPQKFRIKDIAPFVPGDSGTTNYRYGLTVIGGRMRGTRLTGDINLDGFSDVIIGSPYWNDNVNATTAVGHGVVLFGSSNGLYTNDYPSPVVETLSGGRTKPFILTAPVSITNNQFFRGNLSVGDVNGDKSMDLMVPSFNFSGTSPVQGIDLGAVFLFY